VNDRLLAALTATRSSYAEIRVRRVWATSVLVRNRKVEAAGSTVRSGGAARALSPDTGWGVAGFTEVDRLESQVARAADLAAAGRTRCPVVLAPIPIRRLELSDPLHDDPRTIPLAAKRAMADRLSSALHGFDRRIVETRVLYRDEVVETWLATSEGTSLHEVRGETALSLLAIAEEAGNLERALGTWSGRLGGPGVETAIPFLESIASKAVQRLHATPVRPGRYTVILDPAAASCLVHRFVAHLARTTLPGADPDALPIGLRVGPECLTVGDDPTAEGLRGSLACDDEGTPPRRAILVQNGVVTGHLTTRETAARTHLAPSGHARAGALHAAPAPRAANSFLAQGTGTLDDLLRGVGSGVYVSDLLAAEESGGSLTLRAGSARVIRNGSLAEAVKGVQIEGSMLSLLGQVEAVAGDFVWDVSAARCRDGTAGVVSVTAGAPHVRLVDVVVSEGIP
jgi:TldD protein